MPFPSCIYYGYNDHQYDDCVYYPICEMCGSYDHDTHGHNRIISLRRGIKPKNPQHITKNYETCGSNIHITSDHNDIKWFGKREALQAKKAESFKASKTESSNALRSKTPTKSGIYGEVRVNTFRNAIGMGKLFLPKRTLKKSLLPPRWRLLMAQIIQCLGGKTEGFDQITNKDAIILYSLANGINIDYANVFWEDIIIKLNKKHREKVVPYTRFLSLLMMHKMKEGYGDGELTIYLTQVFSTKPRAKPGHKKHSTSSKQSFVSSKEATKGGSSKAPTGSKNGHSKKRKESSLAMDSNPSQPLVSTPIDTGMHKKDQQATGGPTSLGVTCEERANPQLSSGMVGSVARQIEEETSSTIKLKDLAKLVSHVQPSFKDLDSPENDHVIVVDDTDEDEEDEIHAAINDETEYTSVPKSSSLQSSQIQDLTNQFNELTKEVKGLKKQVHELEIKLPGDLKEVPTKLEDFTKTITGLTSQVAELKTLQWELLLEFLSLPKLEEDAKAEAAKQEGEVRKAELVDLLGPKVVNKYYNDKLQYDRYCDKMLNRRAVSRIINCDVLTKKGPITLKVYREDGTSEIIPNFKANDLHIGEWRKVMKACPNKSKKGWETIYKQIGTRMDNIHTTEAELDQRYQYLRFEGLEYIDADVADFKGRLSRIYGKEASYELERVYSRDLMLRLCHMLIACSIVGRSQAPIKGLTVIVRDLLVIDMDELVRLKICKELADTWAWVASGPERQPDAADGALMDARSAPDINEGAQADPVPTQAPQPPLATGPARTMAQRLARLLDSVGATYVRYSETHVPYQRRRVRQRSRDASTSVASLNEDQPDP
uniref:Uncharacterized protein n=1 Tax=Tanacetum cinerariifolium TaxID=118510 RepID=A0A6L2M968_TANCI|nr:hypothetical protein [Tanacetum cinerariifolium]